MVPLTDICLRLILVPMRVRRTKVEHERGMSDLRK